MTRILLALLAFYRRWLSPALHSLGPGGCRYLPTCSEYAAMAIATHGPLRGTGLAIWRLLRCHPFARGGSIRSAGRAMQDLFPTNRYHRRSGGLTGCPFEPTGRILCPKFTIPIFRRRVPAAAAAAAAICAPPSPSPC